MIPIHAKGAVFPIVFFFAISHVKTLTIISTDVVVFGLILSDPVSMLHRHDDDNSSFAQRFGQTEEWAGKRDWISHELLFSNFLPRLGPEPRERTSQNFENRVKYKVFGSGTFGSSNSAVGVVLLSLWFFDDINPTFFFVYEKLFTWFCCAIFTGYC